MEPLRAACNRWATTCALRPRRNSGLGSVRSGTPCWPKSGCWAAGPRHSALAAIPKSLARMNSKVWLPQQSHLRGRRAFGEQPLKVLAEGAVFGGFAAARRHQHAGPHPLGVRGVGRLGQCDGCAGVWQGGTGVAGVDDDQHLG